MTYIVAWTLTQARYASRFILMQEPFVWVNNAERIRGLQRGTEIVLVNAPRFIPTNVQRMERTRIREVMLARDMIEKEVFLS